MSDQPQPQQPSEGRGSRDPGTPPASAADGADGAAATDGGDGAAGSGPAVPPAGSGGAGRADVRRELGEQVARAEPVGDDHVGLGEEPTAA
ncbi:hypothetical protein ABT329_30790, partial [Streptomyces minutiscleroticus]